MTGQAPAGEATAVALAEKRERSGIPPEKLFVVTNDTKKIDFGRPYKYIYFDWWFSLLTFPVVLALLPVAALVRAFPIPARAMGFKMITGPVGEALRRGHHVLFLPEGDLVYLSQEIYRFKPGAFYMSCLHQAPILPMVYVFTKRLRRDGSENTHRPHIRQVFGEPLYPPPRCADGSYPKEELKDMMERAACWMEDTIAHYGDIEPAAAQRMKREAAPQQ
jgi:hypothetical protein